jgi:16S rRNA (guanine527-N7)-methyltransferase
VQHPVEKRGGEVLREGAAAVGVALSGEQVDRLLDYLELLLSWNRKVSLTSVTDWEQAVEVHLVDSLAPAAVLYGAGSILDVGSGGGLPGIPLAVALPGARVTLVESVGKKAGFLKAAIAKLGLGNARALQVRARGRPDLEGIEPAEVVICRALERPGRWFETARPYAVSGGRIVAMVGAETEVPLGPAIHEYALPRTRALRRLAVWHVPRGTG